MPISQNSTSKIFTSAEVTFMYPGQSRLVNEFRLSTDHERNLLRAPDKIHRSRHARPKRSGARDKIGVRTCAPFSGPLFQSGEQDHALS